MKVQHYTDTPASEVPGMPGVSVRWVIAEEDGAPHFAMRVFEVPAGGATELHEHWWEHEVFVLAGSGHVHSAEGDHPLREGSVAFIPGGEIHQIVNDGAGLLRFICLVPHQSLEKP
jgi:quercetin dioxygenase-like cupin family protein